MSDVEGWREVATVEDAAEDVYEESDLLGQAIDGEYRVTEWLDGEYFDVEMAVDSEPRWVPVAPVTTPDPYETAEGLVEALDGDDEYRVVNVMHGDCYIEREVD